MFHTMTDPWPRQEHFRHYMDNVRCTYSITVQIDVTPLRAALKRNGIKAYPAQIYMLAAVVNRLPEFRMGLSAQGEPGYWDLSHPSYTIFHSDTKAFSNIWTPFEQDFPAFYRSCLKDRDLYSHSPAFAPKPEVPVNSFTISSVPWIDFSAFHLNVYGDGAYLAPIFTIGKYNEQNGTTSMPLAMQLHHSACDGYHAGQFVEALRGMAQEYHTWL